MNLLSTVFADHIASQRACHIQHNHDEFEEPVLRPKIVAILWHNIHIRSEKIMRCFMQPFSNPKSASQKVTRHAHLRQCRPR